MPLLLGSAWGMTLTRISSFLPSFSFMLLLLLRESFMNLSISMETQLGNRSLMQFVPQMKSQKRENGKEK